MRKDWAAARERMVREQLIPRGIRDPRVLEALAKVPRHRFLEGPLQNHAYEDRPLPIGHEQTISQPYMVARMTEALKLEGTERVLELGTGSGYQAAVLAELAEAVYTIERIGALLVRAEEILRELGYHNVFFKEYDGTLGWEEHRPYDRIMVTAGAPGIPQTLLAQLDEGGRLLIPVGDAYSQELMRITRRDNNTFARENLGGCRFVRLIGEHGWGEE